MMQVTLNILQIILDFTVFSSDEMVDAPLKIPMNALLNEPITLTIHELSTESSSHDRKINRQLCDGI